MKGLSNPVILVIDSDPLTMTATAATLHTLDYEVHCARDRAAALKAAQRLALDLIICDVNLRGTDGVQLVEELRSLPERSDVPVMFVSASQLPDVISRNHKHGSSFHLRKPFEPKVMLDLVEKALWMPHLVKNHINRPHIPIGGLVSPHSIAASPNSYV